ncbi:MAG: hypothetical protein K6G17_08370 [Oscillospiraceae bacterium]|nr:hypothetical protein [Oscillospiraceae bacterium]
MADRRNKTGSRRFAGAMLIYALVVLVLLLAGTRAIWNDLTEYEATRVERAIEAYVASFDEEHIRAVCADFAAQPDSVLQNGDQITAEVEKIMSQGVSCSFLNGDDKRRTYAVRAGGLDLGRAVMVKGKGSRSGGNAPWRLESESFDFSFLLHFDEVTVADGWQLYCNGRLLDGNFVVGEPQDYEELRELVGDERFTLPKKITYRVGSIVGEAPFSAVNARGEAVEFTRSWTEAEFLRNCSDEQEQEIAEFLDSFLQVYINCLSNVSRDARGNYRKLQPYVIAGGDLDRRVYEAIEGQYWAQSRGDTVTGRTDNLFVDLGGGYYLADISYTLDTLAHEGHVETHNNAKVLLSDAEGRLKAVEIYTY